MCGMRDPSNHTQGAFGFVAAGLGSTPPNADDATADDVTADDVTAAALVAADVTAVTVAGSTVSTCASDDSAS